MQNLNPNSDKYRAPRSFNANTLDDRLGFAMRDEAVTESVSKPVVINEMGYDYARVLARGNYATNPDSSIRPFATWHESLQIPGIMTFDFEPVIAPQSNERKQIIEDVFNSLWSYIRLYNNAADDTQPADLSVLSVSNMLIEMYMAHLRRILDCVRVSMSDTNAYIRNSVLLKALGIDTTLYSDIQLRKQFTGWVNYYNQELVGELNAKQWFGGVFPGEKRWSALCSEIYKDESVDSDYVQLYIIKPRSFYMLNVNESEPGIYTWQLNREDMPTSIDTLLEKVHNLIRATYYDSSARDVQALLTTLSVRGHAKDTFIEQLAYENYPLEGRPLKFTFDFAMLLALHNSSVCWGLRAFDVTQDPATGRLVQDFRWDTTSHGYVLATTPKAVNLPHFCATAAEYINATQWTIACGPEDVQPSGLIDPRTLGVDVIVDSRIVRYNYNTNTIITEPMYQVINFNRQTYGVSPDIWEFISGEIESLADSSAFNMHPLWYVIDTSQRDQSGSYYETHRDWVHRLIGELEILYMGDHDHLAPVKEQFVKNFWGYPLKLRTESKLSLENRRTESIATEGTEKLTNA